MAVYRKKHKTFFTHHNLQNLNLKFTVKMKLKLNHFHFHFHFHFPCARSVSRSPSSTPARREERARTFQFWHCFPVLFKGGRIQPTVLIAICYWKRGTRSIVVIGSGFVKGKVLVVQWISPLAAPPHLFGITR